MLPTIVVRSLIVFVVLCLLSAVRPVARPSFDHPDEARLEVAKSRVAVAARRDGESRDPRDQRALAFSLPAAPFTLAAPPRIAYLLESDAPAHTVVPVIFARSSRGPPVALAS
jgi:hypothetical protein